MPCVVVVVRFWNAENLLFSRGIGNVAIRRRQLESGDDQRIVGRNCISDVEVSSRREAWRKGKAEQSLLRPGRVDPAGDVQEWLGEDITVLDDQDGALLLDYKQSLTAVSCMRN